VNRNQRDQLPIFLNFALGFAFSGVGESGTKEEAA